MTREFTGWHMAVVMVGCFAIIVGVNLTMAYKAISTFPGLEVDNSYVASQTFDADRAAQNALGWDVSVALTPLQLRIEIEDANGVVRPDISAAILGRATHTGQDQVPEFVWNGTAFVAPVSAEIGYWNLRLEMVAEDGTVFRRRFPLEIEEAP